MSFGMGMNALSVLLISGVIVGAPKAAAGDHSAPLLVNVSEVSKDGRPVHNRLTFSCHFDGGHGELECVVVQQDLQEPTIVTRDQQEKRLAELGDLMKSCKEVERPSASSDEDSPSAKKLTAKLIAACKAKDTVALADGFRDMAEIENKTCRLLSVVRDERFRKVDDDTWSLEPDPVPICNNISITGTLKRDPKQAHSWNYTESVVAKQASKPDPLCTATSKTVRFTWTQAVTGVEVGCRYIAM